MSLSLSTKWFLWLSVVVALFAVGQVVGMIWLEIIELSEGASLYEELAEISVLVSISFCVFLLMLGWFWFISRRMIQPVRSIAESAERICEGRFDGRITGQFADDEVGMLVSSLNRAFERYHEAVERLNGFAGQAAHQLRTPLAALRSAGEVCLQKERDGAEYRECIGSMLETVEKLSVSVEKLLMMARLNSDEIRAAFKPVELGRELLGAVDMYASIIEEKKMQISRNVDTGVRVEGDEALLREALRNLVDNAVRYTPEGGRITVSCREAGQNALLQIDDGGPGMPEGVRAAITGERSSVYKDDRLTGRFGLAIVSEVVNIHGGAICVETGSSGGTSVSITVPMEVSRRCPRLSWWQ